METRTVVRKFLGHTAQLTDASFSPDSRWLVTSAMDCTIRLWDVPTGHLVDEFSTERACISLDFSPTGIALATAHVDCLGLYLWTNKTLFTKVTLKAITPTDEPPMIDLPEHPEYQDEEVEEEIKTEDEYTSPEQLDKDMVTMSGLAASRWQNLLNIDIIKRRNKPKEPPKAPKAAPFFLPTVPTLNPDVQFDLGSNDQDNSGSKILAPINFVNLTDFGKLLKTTKQTNNFAPVIEKLKTLGPSMIDFEIKCLAPEGGGSVEVMLQFLRCIESMLQSNKDFEIAESCLGVFLKANGSTVAQEEALRSYLTNIATCHDVTWNRLQERLMYGICVVQNMKNL
ncbi:unnamed protein product [Acanthoscelides obtectus]|nr:unnamed protein product [Acanthoscelides obtectus]CAK1630065.1 WD repeat-containing protein 36 [Acanthoscelides obtectus]